MNILWMVMLVGYALCVGQSIFALTTDRRWMREVAFYAMLAAFGSHTTWLVLQGLYTKRWPIVGTQEMCAFLSWSLVVSYLIAYRWYRANALKAFIFPIVFVLVTKIGRASCRES